MTYTQSSAVYYEWIRDLYPDLFSEIKNKINLGKWEVVGGTWIEPDCNLPGGESWMHNLLYSQRYFQKVLGVKPDIGLILNSFGYTWTLPTFFAKADITAFVTQKLNWNERNVFPHKLFWWESPDGSRVLTYFSHLVMSTQLKIRFVLLTGLDNLKQTLDLENYSFFLVLETMEVVRQKRC